MGKFPDSHIDKGLLCILRLIYAIRADGELGILSSRIVYNFFMQYLVERDYSSACIAMLILGSRLLSSEIDSETVFWEYPSLLFL